MEGSAMRDVIASLVVIALVALPLWVVDGVAHRLRWNRQRLRCARVAYICALGGLYYWHLRFPIVKVLIGLAAVAIVTWLADVFYARTIETVSRDSVGSSSKRAQ
jgi:hypothetical protein